MGCKVNLGGAKGWMYAPRLFIGSNSLSVATALNLASWMVALPHDEWVPAPDLISVALAPAPTVYFLGTSPENAQPSRLGKGYLRRAELVNGRFSYVMQNNDREMMWFAPSRHWIVGPTDQLGQANPSGGIRSIDLDAFLPEKVKEWKVYPGADQPWTNAPGLRCVALTPEPTIYLIGPTPEDMQQKWLGAFDLQAGLVNGMLSYVKQGDDNEMLWHSPHNDWVVGTKDNLGEGKGVIVSRDAKAFTPDTSTAAWEVHLGDKGWTEVPDLCCVGDTEARQLVDRGARTVYVHGETPDGLHRSSCGAFERCPSRTEEVRKRFVRRCDPSIMLWWCDGHWIIGSSTLQGAARGLHAVKDPALTPETICGSWYTAPSDIQRERGKLLDRNGQMAGWKPRSSNA